MLNKYWVGDVFDKEGCSVFFFELGNEDCEVVCGWFGFCVDIDRCEECYVIGVG